MHPDLLVSLTLADIGDDAAHRAMLERTFVRLLIVCDDQGRTRDDRRLLKSSLYPAHDEVTADSIDAEVWCLADAGLVDRYTAATGTDVLQVVSWDEYQHPQKPRPSKLPAPGEGCRVRTRTGFLDSSATATGQLPDEYANAPVAARDESRPEGSGTDGTGAWDLHAWSTNEGCGKPIGDEVAS